MESKNKPLAKIIKVGKVKEFSITDSQMLDSAFDMDLGDTVKITIIGKVEKSQDAGENLFTFSRYFDIDVKTAYLNSVKKFEKSEKEQAEADSTIEDPVAEQNEKRRGRRG